MKDLLTNPLIAGWITRRLLEWITKGLIILTSIPIFTDLQVPQAEVQYQGILLVVSIGLRCLLYIPSWISTLRK